MARQPHAIVSTLADVAIDGARSVRVVVRQRPGEAPLAVVEELRDGTVKRAAWLAMEQLDAVIDALGRARAELAQHVAPSPFARIAQQRLDAMRGGGAQP